MLSEENRFLSRLIIFSKECTIKIDAAHTTDERDDGHSTFNLTTFNIGFSFRVFNTENQVDLLLTKKILRSKLKCTPCYKILLRSQRFPARVGST